MRVVSHHQDVEPHRPLPTSLKIVAALFILGGIWSVIVVVKSSAENGLYFDFGVLGLFVGFGLLWLSRAMTLESATRRLLCGVTSEQVEQYWTVSRRNIGAHIVRIDLLGISAIRRKATQGTHTGDDKAAENCQKERRQKRQHEGLVGLPSVG